MSIEVHTVDSVSQANAALNESARYFGGGTLLMRQVNYGDPSFNRLIISDDPLLKQILVQSDQVSIGAGVTMSEIIRHPDLHFLHEVARTVGGPAIRNMATVGGNLFAPRPYGDLTTAFLALNATVHWADGQQQSIEQFLQMPNSKTGLVTTISLQRPATGAFRYMKVSRVKPKGVSLITIAALLGRENGRVGNARIAFGGMAPEPRRALSAEGALNGSSLDEGSITQCVSLCNEGMQPEDDPLASAWYRTEIAPVYLKRLLLQRSEY